MRKNQAVNPGFAKGPAPLPARVKKAIQAFEICAAAAKTSRAACSFKKARLLYIYNHFAAALSQFESIVSRYPRDAIAPFAAALMLDILNLQGRHDELRRRLGRPPLQET